MVRESFPSRSRPQEYVITNSINPDGSELVTYAVVTPSVIFNP